MANPHPTPRLENLRSPWQPGTSGNPAGYSQGRRISDAIEGLIDERGLQREFGTTAIAMALGKKHLLKQKVTDPETGKDVWVEQKPDLAWFKMIVQRIEPVAQQMDPVTRLRAILDDLERERAAQEEQVKAAESAGPSPSGPGEWKETVESASTLLQDMPAHAGSGQVALKAAQADLAAGDLVTTLAVERPSGQRSVPIRARSSRAVQSGPACCPAHGVRCRESQGDALGWIVAAPSGPLRKPHQNPETRSPRRPEGASQSSTGQRPVRGARPGAGGDRRRGLLAALSPGRRPR